MAKFTILVLVCALAWFTPQARANFDVIVTPSTPGDGSGTNIGDDSGVTITTSYAGSVGIQIIGLSSSARIGQVTINATASGDVSVIIRAGTANFPEPVATVGSISSLGGTSRVRLLTLIVSGSVGDIDLVDIDTASAGTFSGHVICAPASGGQVSNITHLSGTGSGVHGDVVAESGHIDQIAVSNGSGNATIGTSLSPISIRAGNYIGFLTANAVYANISGPSGSPTSMTMGRLTVSGSAGGSLSFTGSIECDGFQAATTPGLDVTDASIDAYIHVAGDFDISSGNLGDRPRVKITRTNGTTRVFSGTLVIDGRLRRTQSGSVGSIYAVDLPPNGLTGQIIIVNQSSDAHPWTAPVKVDSIILDDEAPNADDLAPEYLRLPGTLGGGSVGVVPFTLHKPDCVPAYADSISCDDYTATRAWPGGYGGGTRQTIVMRYRGPVLDTNDNNDSYPPVTVEHRTVEFCNCSLDDWTDYTDDCDIYVPGNGSREVWVSLKLVGGNPVPFTDSDAHRITPGSSGGHTLIRCDHTLAATAPDIDTTPYIFTPICAMRPRG